MPTNSSGSWWDAYDNMFGSSPTQGGGWWAGFDQLMGSPADVWEDQGIFEVNKKTGQRRLKTIEGALGGLSLEQDKSPGAVQNLKNIAEFAPLSFQSQMDVDLMTQSPEEAKGLVDSQTDVPWSPLSSAGGITDPLQLIGDRALLLAVQDAPQLGAALGQGISEKLGLDSASKFFGAVENEYANMAEDTSLAMQEIQQRGAGFETDTGGDYLTELKKDWADKGKWGETARDFGLVMATELGSSAAINALFGLGGLTVQGMAPTYRTMKDAGVDTLTALATSYGSGVGQAVLEKFGLETIMGRSGASKWMASKVQNNVISRLTGNAVVSMFTEGGTEGVQNMLDASIMSAVAYGTANKDLALAAQGTWGETLEQTVLGALMGGVAGTIGGPLSMEKEKTDTPESEEDIAKAAQDANKTMGAILGSAQVVDKVAKAGGINNADLLDVFDKINAEIASAYEPDSGDMMLSEQELAAKSMNVGARLMELTDKIMEGSIPATQQVRDEFMTVVDSFVEMDSSREEWANTQLARVDKALAESQKVENLLSDKKKQQMKQLVDTALLNVNKYTEMEVKTLQTEIIPTIMAAVSVKDSAPQVYEILKQKMANEWSKYFSEAEIARPELIDWNAAIQRLKRVNNDRAIESIKGAIDITDEVSGTLSAGPESVSALTVDKVAEEKTKLDQMKQQTQDMAATLTQQIETQTEDMLSAKNQDLYETAVRHVKSRRDTSVASLKEALGISEKLARKLMKAMEENNVVSPPMRVGNKFAGRQLVDDMIAEDMGPVPDEPPAAEALGQAPEQAVPILTTEVVPSARPMYLLGRIVESARRRGNVASALEAEEANAREAAESIDTTYPRNGDRLHEDLGDHLAKLVTATEDEGRLQTRKQHIQISDMNVMQHRSTLDMLKPAVKRAVSALYRAGEQKLLDSIAELGILVATDSRAMDETTALAERIGEELRRVFPEIHDRYYVARQDGNRNVALALNFASVAHTLFTPHSVRAQMKAAGMSDGAIAAVLSVVHSMALNWSQRNKGSYISFWERIADTLIINPSDAGGKNGRYAGLAFANVTKAVTNWGSRAIMILSGAFDKKPWADRPETVDTILHEVVHELINSGLILELLDPVHIIALERYAGGRIIPGGYGGRYTSHAVHEKLAYGFMHFVSTGKAPNPMVHNAFKLLADYFGTWLDYLRIEVAKKLAEATEILRGEPAGSVGEAVAMDKFLKAKETQRNVERMEDAGFGGSTIAVRVAQGRSAIHSVDREIDIHEVLSMWDDDTVAAFSAMFHNPGLVTRLSESAPLTGDKTLLLVGAAQTQLNLDIGPALTWREQQELNHLGITKVQTQLMPESRKDTAPPSKAAWERERGHEGISDHPDLSEKAEQAYEADKSIFITNKWGGFSATGMEVVKNPSKATLIRMAKEQLKKFREENVLHYKGEKPDELHINDMEFRAVKTSNGDMYYWISENGLHAHVSDSLEKAGVDLGDVGEFYYGDLGVGMEPSGFFRKRMDSQGKTRINQFVETLDELKEQPNTWMEDDEDLEESGPPFDYARTPRGTSYRPEPSASESLGPAPDEMEITKGKLINAVLGQSAALSLLPQQARAQLDASYVALVGSGQSPLNTTPSVDWKNPRGVLNVAVNAGRTFLDKVVHKMFSQRAKVEKWFVDRGLKQYAINFSTLNGVVDRATKVTQIAPQVTDPITLNNIKLPGTRSLKSIMSDLGVWAGLVSKQIGFPIEKVRRDFDLYMTSKRQLEISQNWIKRQQRYVEQVQAWERAGKPEGQKPKKPSRVSVSRKLNAEAHIALAVLDYTYGKETMRNFDQFAKEIVRWGQASIIDKLLHYGMISERAHRAMQLAGEYWIPLEALNEEIVNAGIPEPLNDDSIWNHVHYLQNDTGGERADYLETMIKRAMAVEKVTQRQIAKNKIGQVLMQAPLWWTDTGGFKVLLTNDRPQRVTQAEYMVLPDSRRWEETVVNDKGEEVTHYFRVQPLQPTEFASYMQKRPEKKGKVFAMTHMGDKVYIEITDPLMQDAINGMSEVAAEHASKLATAVAKGLDLSKSFNRNFIARAVTTSRTFIYNALPRDAFQAYLRSRFGLGGKNPLLMPIRLVGDLGKGLFQSAGIIFPSLRERFPVAFAAAQRYMEGSSGMSSLGAQFHTVLAADMNALVLEGNVQKKSSVLEGLKRDLADRARERGITKGKQKLDTTGQRIRFAANAALESVYFPFEMMTEALEMSWRLRELQLGMQQQFRDEGHKNAWEAEKSKMMRDPSYVPDASSVPLVSDSELDYSVRNVTLDFGNHGTWNRALSSLYIFINPKHQDLYSNVKLMRYGDIAGGKTGSGWATKAAVVTTIKAVGLMTLPLLLEYAMWGDDDDWKGLPFHEKASYIHMSKRPDGSFTKVASGLSFFNLIFRDAVLAGLLEADRSDPTAFREWAKRMSEGLPMSAGTGAMQAYWDTKVMGGPEGAGSVALKEFGLGMLPSSLEGAGGLIANRDPFTGKPTQAFAAFKPELPEERSADRYTWHINRVAQLFSLEPQQAAYLLKKYLPGRFRDPLLPGLPSVTGAVDMLAGATGMQQGDEAAPTGFANVGYGSQNPMITRPQFGPQNEWVQDLNLLFAKAQQVKNTVDRKLEEGKDVEAADIIRKNPIYGYYEQLQEARENVTDLFAARRALMANKDMTDTDKTVISYSEFDKPASTIASDVVREVLLAMEGR